MASVHRPRKRVSFNHGAPLNSAEITAKPGRAVAPPPDSGEARRRLFLRPRTNIVLSPRRRVLPLSLTSRPRVTGILLSVHSRFPPGSHPRIPWGPVSRRDHGTRQFSFPPSSLHSSSSSSRRTIIRPEDTATRSSSTRSRRLCGFHQIPEPRKHPEKEILTNFSKPTGKKKIIYPIHPSARLKTTSRFQGT